MHERDIAHGDLKVVCICSPLVRIAYLHNISQDNILISDEGQAQITDFGVACILDVRGYTTLIERNVRYVAPELMPINPTQDGKDPRPTLKSDIYSLAILLLQVCPCFLASVSLLSDLVSS